MFYNAQGRPITTKNYLVQTVSSAKVEKPWSGVMTRCQPVMFKLCLHFKLKLRAERSHSLSFFCGGNRWHMPAFENIAHAQDMRHLSHTANFKRALLKNLNKMVTKFASPTWLQIHEEHRSSLWSLWPLPHPYSGLHPGWYLLLLDWFC